MQRRALLTRGRFGAPLTLALGLALGLTTAGPQAAAQATQHYQQTNLVSNLASMAPVVDPALKNPWGLSRSSKSPWWVSDNGPGLATLYSGAGVKQGLTVTIPPGDAPATTGTPTGTVFNGDANSFQVAPKQAAAFLFVTEDGTVSGWNPNVNGGVPVVEVNTHNKSVFKGATIGTVDTPQGTKTYLYVADFRKGRIAVYDAAFQPVNFGGFNDDDGVPEHFAPFNVQNIGGNLYVAYAKQDADKHDEVDGPGLGRVLIFSTRGRLLGKLEQGSWFNAPWGLTLASSDFGVYSHTILVGQFGGGQIAAFDPVTGKFKGLLMGTDDKPIHIDGLWALAFGNDATAGPATTLFFTAGIDHEANGLFGTLTAVENVQGNGQ
jgi:uncharacterized protein (TIGR03118 family)